MPLDLALGKEYPEKPESVSSSCLAQSEPEQLSINGPTEPRSTPARPSPLLGGVGGWGAAHTVWIPGIGPDPKLHLKTWPRPDPSSSRSVSHNISHCFLSALTLVSSLCLSSLLNLIFLFVPLLVSRVSLVDFFFLPSGPLSFFRTSWVKQAWRCFSLLAERLLRASPPHSPPPAPSFPPSPPPPCPPLAALPPAPLTWALAPHCLSQLLPDAWGWDEGTGRPLEPLLWIQKLLSPPRR